MLLHSPQIVICPPHMRWCAVWGCRWVFLDICVSILNMVNVYHFSYCYMDWFLSFVSSKHNCLSQTTYMGFLDYRKEEVRELGINPSDCSFNPGVFVADLGEWKKQKITKQLEKWMAENVRWYIGSFRFFMRSNVFSSNRFLFFHVDVGRICTAVPWQAAWPPLQCWSSFMINTQPLIHCGTSDIWVTDCFQTFFLPDLTEYLFEMVILFNIIWHFLFTETWEKNISSSYKNIKQHNHFTHL